MVNKWTRKPPTFGSKQGEQDIKMIQSNLLGVGGDKEEVSIFFKISNKIVIDSIC